MTYNPQIPAWGEQYLEENKEKLVKYHEWLSITGVKTGLISPKTDQYIWDEFIVHSLYFYKIIEDLGLKKASIFDIGTGGGIPGIPIAIASKRELTLIDNKKSRIFELERLIKLLEMEELFAEERNAIELLNKEENAIFTLRCYLSTSNLIKEVTKTLKKNTYLVSSNEKNRPKTNEKFHVKQEKFFINKNDYRFIDVITSM
jgi:16S rRNA (guanine527-N7)-methyltransferase